LTALLGATESLSPLVSLLILVGAGLLGAGLLVFSGAAAAFARPVLTPMWVTIRETRAR
jgi:hypothetical protein